MAIKRISRRDISTLSAREVLQASRGPYGQLLSHLKPYKGRFILGILFGALFGMTNGVLMLAVKYVSRIVFHGGDFNPRETRIIEMLHLPMPQGDEATLLQVLLACSVIPAIMLIRGAFGYLNAYCMLWTSLRVLNDIRCKLFDRLMAQSLGFFGRSKGGDLIQTVFNQTRMAQSALTTIASDVVKQPVGILSALAVLFYLDWQFTLATLVLFPLCIIPVLVIGKKVRRTGAAEEEEAGMLMVVMQEAFAGIRVVKSYARETHEVKKFSRANEQMLRMIMRWQKAMEIVGPMVETIASMGLAAALVYCWWLGKGADTFILMAGGLVMLYPPFKTLSRVHILMQKCLAATSKVFELIETVPEVQDKLDAVPLQDCKGAVQFEGVTFRYGKGPPAVRNVSLTIPAGRTYALVGESGAGKSTLFSLLLRFYDPDKGRILIDGHDLRDITQDSLRGNIGIVTQDTFLFHDTIYNNILYGRLDATREEVELAAQRAFAHDFILEQPHGYDTHIGDKGCLLSGGQQQRISIARAILRNAPILLLDEATSALDSEAERKIQSALENLAVGKTVIAIAHRLSTILQADKIIVMQDGKVVESGTHQELFDNSIYYRRLYDLQFQSATDLEPVG